MLAWLWAVVHPPRLARSVSYREAEWSQEDVTALAAVVEKGRVGPHGQPMSEATSVLANPQNPEQEWDYEFEVWTDFAAKRRAEGIRAFKKQYGDDANLDEYVFTVKKVDREMVS